MLPSLLLPRLISAIDPHPQVFGMRDVPLCCPPHLLQAIPTLPIQGLVAEAGIEAVSDHL
jgi:hypothetical protein